MNSPVSLSRFVQRVLPASFVLSWELLRTAPLRALAPMGLLVAKSVSPGRARPAEGAKTMEMAAGRPVGCRRWYGLLGTPEVAIRCTYEEACWSLQHAFPGGRAMSAQNSLVRSFQHVSGFLNVELVHIDERLTHHCADESGWVGLRRPGLTGQELFALALPGDDLTHLGGHGRAAAVALTEARLGPIDDPKPVVPEFLLWFCFCVAVSFFLLLLLSFC